MSLVNLEAYTAKRQEQEDAKRQEWQQLGEKLKQQLPQDRFFGAAENAANSFAAANTLAAQSPELKGAPTAKESDILEQNLYKESKPDDKALDVLYETQAKMDYTKAMKGLASDAKEEEQARKELQNVFTKMNMQRGVIGQGLLLMNRGQRIEATYGKNPNVTSLNQIPSYLIPELATGIVAMAGAGNPGYDAISLMIPGSAEEKVQQIKSWLSGEAVPSQLGEKLMPLVNLTLREMGTIGDQAKGQMRALVATSPLARKKYGEDIFTAFQGMAPGIDLDPDELGLAGVKKMPPIKESPLRSTPQYNTPENGGVETKEYNGKTFEKQGNKWVER